MLCVGFSHLKNVIETLKKNYFLATTVGLLTVIMLECRIGIYLSKCILYIT